MRSLAAILLVATVTVGCSPPEADPPIRVSVASSLVPVFGALADAFEADHPGERVEVNGAGSPTLREQILEGAPIDVFAPAGSTYLDAVRTAGLVLGEPMPFASNRLVIAVPAGNPAGVAGLDDFGRPELLVGLCAVGVPCGDAARRALAAAGVTPLPDTEEPNVRMLLAKIEAGALDVGLVYVTDVAGSGGGVETVGSVLDESGSVEYWMARVATGLRPDGATAFVAYVVSDAGQAILREYGFLTP